MWLGYTLNNILFYIMDFCHYLPMVYFFVNEYYMAAILHYMTYESVMGNPKMTIKRFKQYTKRRDIFVILYKVCFSIFFWSLFIASVCEIAIKYKWNINDFATSNTFNGLHESGTITNFYDGGLIFIRAAICCVFAAAIIRMALARSNAKKRNY